MKRPQRATKPFTTMREALSDPALLGRTLEGETFLAWRTLLIAASGEPLTDTEREVYRRLTAREREPLKRVDELVAVVGRRGGKSRALATFATYLATLVDHSRVLVPGERGVILLIAPDQRQATIALEYANAAIERSPILAQLVGARSRDTIELRNRITIEVRAASFRRLRGPTYIAVLADEAAFWMTDEVSANPDTEILNAVRPGLATTRGPLIIASSPYARRGVLWDTYKRHYGPDGDPLVLVAQGTSRDLNPSLSQSVVDRALERDHAAASAEYLAQFRTDLEAFVSQEVVEACIERGVRERPYSPKHRYIGFVDPSGGMGDSFTLAIAHRDNDVAVVDCIREVRPPFSPETVTEEFASVLKSYNVRIVNGDRYAGEWPREQFRKLGIAYHVSDKTKSDLYRDLLPLLNSGRVALLDVPRLESQLCGLERRTSRAGRDAIDHSAGSHDDLANSVAGAVVNVVGSRRGISMVDFLGDPEDEKPEQLSERDKMKVRWTEKVPWAREWWRGAA